MLGPEIISRSISVQRIKDRYGNSWQYHPRSDRHSKIACWAILFDLLLKCPLLRIHIAAGKVGFGINHTMIDFTSDRRKNLDLVLCIPRAMEELPSTTFALLADGYSVELTATEKLQLSSLPQLPLRPVGEVLLAVEAKAVMTAHVRAGPRLFDELTSAWHCINGSAPQAIAVAFGMINAASEFVSPDLNKFRLGEKTPVVSRESQPNGVVQAQSRIRSLKVRGHVTERGYDAVGLITVSARNDGSPVTVAPVPPALPAGDSLHYETMVLRAAGLYDSRFQLR